MTEKRIHQYELTFKYLKNNKGEIMDKTPIFLPFQNYDDIYKIIEILNEKNLFKDASQTNQFVLGLKLFGDVSGFHGFHEKTKIKIKRLKNAKKTQNKFIFNPNTKYRQ